MEVIEILVEAGVDINEPDNYGETAAHILTDVKSLRVIDISIDSILCMPK